MAERQREYHESRLLRGVHSKYSIIDIATSSKETRKNPKENRILNRRKWQETTDPKGRPRALYTFNLNPKVFNRVIGTIRSMASSEQSRVHLMD